MDNYSYQARTNGGSGLRAGHHVKKFATSYLDGLTITSNT